MGAGVDETNVVGHWGERLQEMLRDANKVCKYYLRYYYRYLGMQQGMQILFR